MGTAGGTVGTVFNIQHFSIEDGPGIRTVVFLKGCPLRCRWCANPESQRSDPEMGWTAQNCIGCGCCVRELTELCCRFSERGKEEKKDKSVYFGEKDQTDTVTESQKKELFWDTEKPIPERKARRVCPSEAFHVIGKFYTVEEVLQEVEKDRPFYLTSGGGITISGGEPLMQPQFTLELLREAGRRGIHRAIETCGCTTEEIAVEAAGELDYILTDLKCASESLHIQNTGGSNRQILQNLRAVRAAYPDKPIRVRTPVIPGFNDSEEEIGGIIGEIRDLHVEYELLKYHRLGAQKYESLHRIYPMGEVELSEERFVQLKKFAEEEMEDIR